LKSLRHTEHTRAGGQTRPTAQCAARGEVRVITPWSRGEHTKCASVGKHGNCSHARFHSFSSHARMFGIDFVRRLFWRLDSTCPIRIGLFRPFPLHPCSSPLSRTSMRRVTPGCTLRTSPLSLVLYTGSTRHGISLREKHRKSGAAGRVTRLT
jgi:hypothetical protein